MDISGENSLYDEVFEATALTPGIWLQFARRLKYAGDTLYEKYQEHYHEVQRGLDSVVDTLTFSLNITSTLLYGLAFENILKAILIQDDPCRVQNGKLVKWPGGGHDLTALVEAAGLDLGSQSAQLLERLSMFVTWAGRYPVPIREKDMFTRQYPTSDLLPPEPIQPSEKEYLDAIFTNLIAKIKVT